MSVQEYMTGNTMVAFPFKDSALRLCQVNEGYVATGANATLPRDFLLDAVIRLPKSYASYADALVLRSISSLAGNNFRFIFASGATTILTVTMARPVGGFTSGTVLSFQQTDGLGYILSGTLLAGPSFEAYLQAITPVPSTADFGLTGLPVEDCIVELEPEGIISIEAGGQVMTGICRFVEGYNMDLQSTPQDGTVDAQTTLSVVSGAGAGKHDGCSDLEPVDYVGTLNGVGGNTLGEFSLVTGADNCYRFVPGTNAVVIYNDCPPGCSDTGAVLDFSLFRERLTNLDKNLRGTADKVNLHITEWNDGWAKRAHKLRLDGFIIIGNVMTAEGETEQDTQRFRTGASPNWASIIAMAHNPSIKAKSVKLTLTFPNEFIDPKLKAITNIYFEPTGGQKRTGIVVLPGPDKNSDSGVELEVDMPPGSYIKMISLVRADFTEVPSGKFGFKLENKDDPEDVATRDVLQEAPPSPSSSSSGGPSPGTDYVGYYVPSAGSAGAVGYYCATGATYGGADVFFRDITVPTIGVGWQIGKFAPGGDWAFAYNGAVKYFVAASSGYSWPPGIGWAVAPGATAPAPAHIYVSMCGYNGASAGYEVIGAGSSIVNDVYCYYGTSGGYAVYHGASNRWWLYHHSTLGWCLGVEPTEVTPPYYMVASVAPTPPTVGWSKYSAGTDPAPTLVAFACPWTSY